MEQNELLEAALKYAERLPVFPCHPETKKPLTPHGFKDATDNAETIRQWWTRWPDAMIGVPTGERTRFWVLDVDDPTAFEAVFTPPETRRVDTGKGYHLYFKFDPDNPIGNAQRRKGKGWPFFALPGAETRGEGGYVIVPPSVHPTGRKYAWNGNAGTVEAPKELLALMRRDMTAKSKENPKQRAIGEGSAYGLAALKAECESIRAAGEGEQESTLSESALKIGGLVKGGELEEAHARAALIEAGEAMTSHNPRDPWTREKIERKVRDRMAAGEARSAPKSSQAGETLEVDPVDLWAGHTAPELPQGLLPGPIETFARSHAETMGVDPAGLAMACLAVCAAAITDEIELQVKQHDPTWRESARLWVALVGSPSMKKSPIIGAAARPLRKADAMLMEAYTKQRNAYDLLGAKERKTAERPRQERRVISDSTVEAAQEVLRDSPRGVLNLQDELSGFFGAMDKYAPGKGAQADRGFWLQAYNGGTYSLNRIGRGASLIPNCSISLLGGIQPEPIRAIAGETNDDGLLQRLIPIVLRPGRVGRDAPSDGTTQGYERLIERLSVLRAGDGPLTLDRDARAVRERLEQEHLELVQSLESVSPKMAAHFGKHDGLFARLCVLWHCIERAHGGRVPDEISGATAERVAQFMVQFIRRNAVAFYAGLLGMSHGHDRLVQLAAWIVAKRLDRVVARDVQASGQGFRHITADDVRALCEKLEAFGWGTWGEPASKSNRPPFLINPRVHQLFADHGKAEAERREKARKLIAETIGA